MLDCNLQTAMQLYSTVVTWLGQLAIYEITSMDGISMKVEALEAECTDEEVRELNRLQE